MKVNLSSICEYGTGKVSVSSLNADNYISTENMLPGKGGVTAASALPQVAQTQAYRKGDALISNIRPYFKKIWQAPFDGGCSNDVLVFRAKDGVDPVFLYYVLSEDSFFEYAAATAKGTKMPRGDKVSIMRYQAPLFPLETQRRISGLLRSIDNKIEVNAKINDNLEQQIQAQFMQSFANIFRSERSEIHVMLEFSNGKKRPAGVGEIPVYGGNGVLAYANQRNAENCVIIGRVGAYCGNVYLSTGPCWVTDNAIQAKCKLSNTLLFAYYVLKTAGLSSHSIGSGQPLITQNILNAIPFSMPPMEKVREFDTRCMRLQRLIDNNIVENHVLTNLRDALLPRLMSGEIDASKLPLAGEGIPW